MLPLGVVGALVLLAASCEPPADPGSGGDGGEGEGENPPVGEGEGEGENPPVGEGEGEGEDPAAGEGEGEGEGEDPAAGEGEGEGEGADADGDGFPDAIDASPGDPCDPDGDALACPTGDTDGDGVENVDDDTPTDPCVPDDTLVACGTADADGDGIQNGVDPSPLDACEPDLDALSCPTGDADGDGAPNDVDLDPIDACNPDPSSPSCSTGGGGAGEGEGEGESGGSTGEGEGEGESGGTGAGEGEGEGEDGGLGGSQDAFCSGTGAAVNVAVGGTGQTACAGQIAQDAFQFAVCACDTIIGGNGAGSRLTTDSFDSRLGLQDEQPVEDDGHVGTNNALDTGGLNPQFHVGGGLRVGGAVNIKANSSVARELYADGDVVKVGAVGGDAFVTGDLQQGTIGGDALVGGTIAGGVSVAGTRSPGASVVSVDPCPCDPANLLDVAAIASLGATANDNDNPDFTALLDPTIYANPNAEGAPDPLVLPCGRYYLTAIRQESLAIVATGRTVLFVDGDVNVRSLEIGVEGDGEIDVFVNGDLIVQSAARLGAADEPAAVRTYIAGAVSFPASTLLGGNVYAPDADIVFGAALDVFGSLFVNTVRFSGNSTVHFDSAIRDASDTCEPPAGGEGEGEGEGGAEGEGEGGGAECSSCFDATCGDVGLACLLPDGVCGACRTTIDCCPGEVCLPTGECGINDQ
jgi:hypothetical protein